MKNLSANHQRQLWTIERMERICRTTRDSFAFEPCLEQYEQQVARIMDEQVSEAASQWIELIVNSLRNGEIFQAESYLPTA